MCLSLTDRIGGLKLVVDRTVDIRPMSLRASSSQVVRERFSRVRESMCLFVKDLQKILLYILYSILSIKEIINPNINFLFRQQELA